jgi:hypothetical protein
MAGNSCCPVARSWVRISSIERPSSSVTSATSLGRGAEPRLRRTHLHPQHHQLLLDAVVEVLREPVPFGVLGADDPPGGVLERFRLPPDHQQLRPQGLPHPLQRVAEPTDLVATVHREGPLELPARDRRGGGGQFRQGAGHDPGEREGQRPGDHEQERHHQRARADEPLVEHLERVVEHEADGRLLPPRVVGPDRDVPRQPAVRQLLGDALAGRVGEHVVAAVASRGGRDDLVADDQLDVVDPGHRATLAAREWSSG